MHGMVLGHMFEVNDMTIEEFENRRYLEQLSEYLTSRNKMFIKWRDVHGMTYKEMSEAHNKKYGKSYYTCTTKGMQWRYYKAIERLKYIADQEALLCAEKCHI